MPVQLLPVRDQTTQPSSPSSTKLPVGGAICSSSATPVCWGQPEPGSRAMRAVSVGVLQGRHRAARDAGGKNSTTAVSSTSSTAVRRMRLFPHAGGQLPDIRPASNT